MEEIHEAAARNPREPRPATVSWAVALLLIQQASSVPQLFLTWQPSGKPWVQGAIIGMSFAIVVCLIYQISVGRNWARWIYLVFTTLGILMDLTTLRQTLAYYSYYFHHSHAVTVLWAFGSALEVVALFLLFVSPGRRWFRRPA
jgi:hypothetical protein